MRYKELLIIFSLFITNDVLCQEKKNNNPKYYLHSIADTIRNPHSKEYINFWVDFLYEENDSLRKLYWEPKEIIRFHDDYALFYDLLFQYPPHAQLDYFKPYILSTYFKDSIFHIVTAFYNFNFKPNDTTSSNNFNPFAIVEVGVHKTDDGLFLTNLIDERTIGWKKYKFNKIHYLYEPTLKVHMSDVQKANDFVDSLSNIFSIEENINDILYIVCKTPEQLGQLLGFNFFFAGYTSGRAYIDASIIITGNGNFNYPHELTHIILDPYLNPGRFLSEGLSTYFGGNGNESYEQRLRKFKEKHSFISDTNFSSIVEKPNFPDSYLMGALIVDVIFQNHGVEGILMLKNSPNNVKNFLEHMNKIFGYNRAELYNKINLILSEVK